MLPQYGDPHGASRDGGPAGIKAALYVPSARRRGSDDENEGPGAKRSRVAPHPALGGSPDPVQKRSQAHRRRHHLPDRIAERSNCDSRDEVTAEITSHRVLMALYVKSTPSGVGDERKCAVSDDP